MGHNIKYSIYNLQVPHGPSMSGVIPSVNIHYIALNSYASIQQFKVDINPEHTSNSDNLTSIKGLHCNWCKNVT